MYDSCLFTSVRRKLRFDGGAERQERGSERCAGEQQRMKLGRARRPRGRSVSQVTVIWFLHRNASLIVDCRVMTLARDDIRRKDRTRRVTAAQLPIAIEMFRCS